MKKQQKEFGKQSLEVQAGNSNVAVGEHSVKIMRALNNNKFKARTIEGIAKEIGSNRVEVLTTIKSDPILRQNLKIYRRKSPEGRVLVTTKERFSREAELKDKFIDAFSSREVNLDDY